MTPNPTPARLLVLGALVCLSSAMTGATADQSFEDDLLNDATLVFKGVATVPSPALPASVLMNARAIAVFPRAYRDGGLYYGTGVVSGQSGLDGWSPPAVIAFQGALPIELEAAFVDFVFVARTARGVDYLTQAKYMAPVWDTIPSGPVTSTARLAKTDLVAYMRFGTYFAGVTIADWEFTEMRTSNERLYGRPYSTDEVFRTAGFFHLQKSARAWRDALAAYFRNAS